MRNFRELIIWQEGMKLAQFIYKIANHLPTEEKYGLKSQICRAAVSIPSNIAEGCSRSSEKEFKHFLEIALGSSFELETQIILLFELSMITSSDYENIFKIINNEQMKINAFISKIKQRS